MRLSSTSFMDANVSATRSACSLTSSARFVSFSKSPFPARISFFSSPTRLSRSFVSCSASLSDAIRVSFRRGQGRYARSRPFSPLVDQCPERPEVEVQIPVFETELALQLLHPLLELHERLPHPLDLVLR